MRGAELRFVVSATTLKDAVGCPRCKTAMEEVARIKPLQKVEGLIAYACPSCRFTFGEILPAHGREEP
jgi:transposase-like protein